MVKYLIVQFSARMRLSIYQYFERKEIVKERKGPIKEKPLMLSKTTKMELKAQ